MRRDFAALLLFSIGASLVVLTAAGPVEIQVSVDPNRPLALYEGPQSHRRDSRGRPFKSIIVTSKPFGIGNPDSNSVQDSPSSSTTTPRPLNVRSTFKPFIITSKPFGFANSATNQVKDTSTTSTTTSTTTTTTPSPIVKGTPTIPFFSISCTFGSSCSQIISARQTLTVKPTFKPYTKEEINKFKGTLSSRFPSKVGGAPAINLASSTTTPATAMKKTSSGTNHLWRIRTTSPAPSSTSLSTTTAAPSTTATRPNPSRSKPSNNWNNGGSRWKWPTHIGSAAFEDRERDEVDSSSTNQRIETVTSVAVKSTPLSAGYQQTTKKPATNFSAFNGKPYPVKPENYYENKDTFLPTTTSRPNGEKSKVPLTAANNNNGGGWFSMLAASLSTLQNHQTLPQRTQQPQHQKSKTTLSTPFPVKIISRPAKLRPNYQRTTTTTAVPTLQQQDGWNPTGWTGHQDANYLEWKPEKTAEPILSITLADNQNYHHHEVVSSKGNKISLITGARNKLAKQPIVQQEDSAAATVPPEVSVSSHVIGLKVKPKSLEGATFIEHVQGVAIETDGENVNLSDLIMKQELPRRPARYLPHTQRNSASSSRRDDEWGRAINRQHGSYHPNPSFGAMDGWRPVRFPVNP